MFSPPDVYFRCRVSCRPSTLVCLSGHFAEVGWSYLPFLVQSAGGLRLTLSSRTGERRTEYGVLSLLYSYEYRTVSVSPPSRKSARLGGTRFLPQEPFSASATAANPVAVRVPRRIRTLQKPSCSDVR